MAGSKRKQSSTKLSAKRINQELEGKRENVFLFVPNLIGYTRVILAAFSLYYMRENPKVCTVLYCISCLLDAFDGMFARMLNQSSRFGAVLDMVTDRCTTACLLCFLMATYPSHALLFQGLVSLDFSSHYIHMYTYVYLPLTTALLSRVLPLTSKLIPKRRRVLFVFCAANELFFVCLYLMDFYKRPMGLQVAPILPDALVQLANADKNSLLFQLVYVWIPHLTWPQLLGALTFPICAGKQIINGVQFWKAAKALCDMDVMERRARRAHRK